MAQQPMTISQEAAAAAAKTAETRDYYANLTDEERAEEGLPPRGTPIADPVTIPDQEKKPDEDPEDDPDDEEEGDPGEDNEDTLELLDAIEAMREELGGRIGKLEAPAEQGSEDTLMEAALEHQDPVIRALGKRLQASEEQLGALQAEAREDRVDRQLVQDESDRADLKRMYFIGGKPMTDAHINKIDNYMNSHKEVARHLSFEEVTRVVFPSAVKARSASSPRRGDANGGGAPTATIVDTGTSGGAPAERWKPRAGESVESAVAAAGERLFGVKR